MILVIVLGLAYRILENVLHTEAYVERAGRPEKVGQAVIAHLRDYLDGVVFRNLGTDRVFQIINRGSADHAQDEIQFYTTREPMPQEDPQPGLTPETGNERMLTAVTFYVKENNQGLLTLFRRENVAVAGGDPFETGGGINHEIYDRIQSFNVLAFDPPLPDEADLVDPTQRWLEFWDSTQRIQAEAEEEAAAQAAEQGIPRVAEESQQALDPLAEPQVLPPAAIPGAVRLEIAVLAGDEKGVYRNPDGTPMAPRLFTAIIPLPTAIRVPLSLPEEAAAAEGMDPGGMTPEEPKGGPKGGNQKPRG